MLRSLLLPNAVSSKNIHCVFIPIQSTSIYTWLNLWQVHLLIVGSCYNLIQQCFEIHYYQALCQPFVIALMTRCIYFGLFHLFLLLFCFCFEEYCGTDLNVKKLFLYESKISPIIRGLSFPYEERNFFPADFYKLSSPSNKLEESFSLINYKLINLFKVLMRRSYLASPMQLSLKPLAKPSSESKEIILLIILKKGLVSQIAMVFLKIKILFPVR